jgi:hypothetical protein
MKLKIFTLNKGDKMTKLYFYQNYVAPYLKRNDKPFNRQIWNDTLDNLQKDRIITTKQADKWIYPKSRLFV